MRENQLLEHIYRANSALPAHVTLPPGDDMGAIDFTGSSLLVAVDQLADGVHIDLAVDPLELVGRKAVTRNLSDVAAMAAKPVAAVVAVSLPRGFGQERATALFDAMRQTAADFGCPLIGGDLAVWDHPLLASVTVFAQPHPGVEPITRTGSQPGDAIYVTGHLGGSLPTGHHLTFTPRLAAAAALAADPATRPRAMIDLSDGLAQDLPRLTTHAQLHADRLPLRPCDTPTDRPAWQHALGDGEDYELLFAAAPDAPIPPQLAGVPITRIGTVTHADGHVVLDPHQQRLSLAEATRDHPGWEHRG
ncbi:MAG: thiamine-phosphate kinase [Planctomycetota bacterium]